MDVTDEKRPVFEIILAEINRERQDDRPFVIGINGIDGAGKTSLAALFERFLVSQGYKTQVIALDDFRNPQAHRYAGDDRADNYFNKSFAVETIINELLIPIHRGGSFTTELTLLDLNTDSYDIKKRFSFNSATLVIFEGVFLFRKELAPYIDFKIFLDIPFEESKKRALLRDSRLGQEGLKKYDEKYLPAQKKYLVEYPPARVADLVIDNTDWQHPRVRTLG
ncbi:MAG: hypothetical protein V3S02_04625 [Dehalococcoidales bacterium]